MEKIEFEIVSLENQKPTNVRGSHIELHEKYLRYYCDFNADEPVDDEDHALGWEDVITFLDCKALKSAISVVERCYIEKTKRWAVHIVITGTAQDLKVFFKKRKDSEEFEEKLMTWWLST